MNRHLVCLLAFIGTFSFAAHCPAQTLQKFNPNATSIERIDDLNEDVLTVAKTSRTVTEESHVFRNTLVVAALGLTFTLGIVITATTLRQDRPSSPQQTSYFPS